MKQNKPTIIGIVLVLVVALFATSYFVIANRCTLDGQSVCYDKETERFLIEENATLKIQVESEALGEYVVATWNEAHPNHIDAITYEVAAPLTAKQLNEPFQTDILVTKQNDAAYFLDKFHDMGGKLDSIVGSKIPVQIQDTINLTGYYFIQNSISGPTFAYNETLMKSLGYNIEDSDTSGLPDVFDSWTKIMNQSKTLNEQVDVIFPLTFTDQQSFYPMLTAGRWTLNFTKKGSNPGFNTREFREGLELIDAMGDIVWDRTVAKDFPDPNAPIPTETKQDDHTNAKDGESDAQKPSTTPDKPSDSENTTETNTDQATTADGDSDVKAPVVPTVKRNVAEELTWQYEKAFYENRALFTIINDFDMAAQYEESTGQKYVYAPFPSYQDHRLSPMAETDGYVVSKDVQYPSAAAEVIRILRSPEAVSIHNTSTGKIPVYHKTYIDELKIEDRHTKERIFAYNTSDTPPVMALDNNPNVLARTLYSEVDIMQPLRDLYNGKIDVKKAQEEIQKLADEWIAKNDILKEA
ncbi:ABC transporter substrate-binding protein [Erysipelothrix sp. HDW6B]|uniref:ABC transporter substrate-binding protein n=1 Tax=Erysipelothrix sp. HDW6B TaxID=2714929 RepID=UPI00140E35CC|nr:ABC transporter substrate-binding protein [Erysipelothrix sp. HDW6B]QIK87006.1 ABC transporter substrate-binding protein [Erysipelothrix sp. HDW6B]